MRKARIGIAANILIMEGGIMPGIYRAYVNNDYVESVEKAGGIPVLLPVLSKPEGAYAQVAEIDGLLLSGGYDIDPVLYGEQPSERLGFVMSEVDRYYIELVKAAEKEAIPILGICKGMQILNIAFGGGLYQDIGTQREGCSQHFQQAPRYAATHGVEFMKGSFLSEVFGGRERVNSFHHQAIKKVARGFRVTACAEDGVIEGIESEQREKFLCGVQWHPEMMAKFGDKKMLFLFQSFIRRCKAKQECEKE